MRRFLGWSGVAALTLFMAAAATLVAIGVPKPPALTTEDVGRVGWSPILRDLGSLWRSQRSGSLVGWMPDGRGMLVRARHRVFTSRLHRLEEPGGRPALIPQLPRNASGLATEPGRDYGVLSWDRDGDEQYQLYRWDAGDADPVRLTDGSERAFFGAFEPGGPRFAYVSNRRNGADMDVYVADPRAPGSEELVLRVEGTWAVADWSPEGDVLLLARVVSSLENEIFVFDLGRRALNRVSPSAGEPVAHGSLQWSGDGRTLYYVSDRGSEFRRLRRLDLATGAERILTGEIPWDVTSVREVGDGSRLLLVVNEDGRDRLYVLDVDAATPEPLDLFPSGLVGAVGVHPERPLLALNHVDALGVVRGYVYDLERGELQLWSGPTASATEVESGRRIRYPTFDRVDGEPRRISAFVYRGAGSGPRPVLINIHGGPEAQAKLTTGYARWQRAGVTVIAPNVRGSTGYGKTFTRLDDGYLREDAVRDIGALLDWVAEQPDMDAGRVGVIGGSYGGYMVLASLVHFGERVRCGVDVVGISNFVTFLENTADYRRDLRRAEYGDERDPDMRAFLESISPLNNAERIVSPLMVVQGANDPRVPVSESRQMVERVRGNDLAVRYIEGANEGHGFADPWNSLYASAAQFEMMEACLAR